MSGALAPPVEPCGRGGGGGDGGGGGIKPSLALAHRGIVCELMHHVRHVDVRALACTSRAVLAILHDMSSGGGYWRMLIKARFAHVPVDGVYDDATCLRMYAWAQPVACAETVSNGWAHVVSIANDGSVECTGKNDQHKRLSGWKTAVPADRRCVQVSAGDFHSLALLDDGRVVGWGWDDDGQVSGAAQAVLPGRRCVQVSAGRCYSLALLDDGRVVGWGVDDCGQVRGAAVAVPAGRRCVQVSAGGWHALALLDDGRVVAWGCDEHYQVSVRYDGNANWKNWIDGLSWAWPPLPAGRRCLQVSAGSAHSMALLDDGHVVAWGSDQFDQVGKAGTAVPAGRRCVQVSAGKYYSFARLDDGRIVGWGAGLGDGDGAEVFAADRRCVQVSAHYDRVFRQFDDGEVDEL